MMIQGHTHMMWDLETLSTAPNASIMSIGAVLFTFEDGITAEFKRNISLKTQYDLGLHVDPDTVAWWKSQPPEIFKGMREGTVELESALTDLQAFAKPTKYIWSNGSAFDTPIVESALRALGRRPFWKYWDAMCFRTIMNMTGTNFNQLSKARVGHHDSLSDAKFQVEVLMRVLNGK